MHASTLFELHVLSESLAFLKHHKLVILLVTAGVLWLGYVASTAPEPQILTQALTTAAGVSRSYSLMKPLAVIDDPQYTYEYAIRAQSINDQLEQLRKATQADRAYAMTYRDGVSPVGSSLEERITDTFEVVKAGISPQISHYQGFSRASWLHRQYTQQAFSGTFAAFPRAYGLELNDPYGNAIGYVGIENLQAQAVWQGNEIELLRETASAIVTTLIKPLPPQQR